MREANEEITELQWAHKTLQHIIEIVQMNGFVTEELRQNIVTLNRGLVELEAIIEEQLTHARRRRNDGPYG